MESSPGNIRNQAITLAGCQHLGNPGSLCPPSLCLTPTPTPQCRPHTSSQWLPSLPGCVRDRQGQGRDGRPRGRGWCCSRPAGHHTRVRSHHGSRRTRSPWQAMAEVCPGEEGAVGSRRGGHPLSSPRLPVLIPRVGVVRTPTRAGSPAGGHPVCPLWSPGCWLWGDLWGGWSRSPPAGWASHTLHPCLCLQMRLLLVLLMLPFLGERGESPGQSAQLPGIRASNWGDPVHPPPPESSCSHTHLPQSLPGEGGGHSIQTLLGAPQPAPAGLCAGTVPAVCPAVTISSQGPLPWSKSSVWDSGGRRGTGWETEASGLPPPPPPPRAGLGPQAGLSADCLCFKIVAVEMPSGAGRREVCLLLQPCATSHPWGLLTS